MLNGWWFLAAMISAAVFYVTNINGRKKIAKIFFWLTVLLLGITFLPFFIKVLLPNDAKFILE